MDGARARLLGLLLLYVGGATSLKNVKITVPERVRVGDSALLTCSYDLEDATLYTIKWYLDDSEFYRYVPKKDPPHTTFPVRGIKVNVSSSNMQDVTLVNVRRNLTGRYKCEVSEDQPRYDTRIQEADILVVDVPATSPRITVDRQHLHAGEKLRANCTSGASRPASNITWTLNGAPLNNHTMRFRLITQHFPARSSKGLMLDKGSQFEKSSKNDKEDDKNLTHSVLTLNTTGLFRDGRIRLRCFAEITPIYRADALVDVTDEGPSLASITGDASPHNRQPSGCGSVWTRKWTLMLVLNLVLGLLLGPTSSR